MKKIIFSSVLFCVFGLNINAQKLFVGFNLAPQINVINFKKDTQSLPLHTMLWCDFASASLAVGYTVAGNNFVQAIVMPQWYVVNLINSAGKPNFIGVGYVIKVPETKEAIFFEVGSNYDRSLSTKSFNCTISAGIFITRRLKIF